MNLPLRKYACFWLIITPLSTGGNFRLHIVAGGTLRFATPHDDWDTFFKYMHPIAKDDPTFSEKVGNVVVPYLIGIFLLSMDLDGTTQG